MVQKSGSDTLFGVATPGESLSNPNQGMIHESLLSDEELSGAAIIMV